MNVVNTLSFSRTHTATYVSDKMRNLLKTLILDYGLDPKLLVDAWSDWVHDVLDRDFLQGSIAKALGPPAGCTYRVLLVHRPGARDLGLSDVPFLSLGGLAAREAGTVIGTPDIMASATYYR